MEHILRTNNIAIVVNNDARKCRYGNFSAAQLVPQLRIGGISSQRD